MPPKAEKRKKPTCDPTTEPPAATRSRAASEVSMPGSYHEGDTVIEEPSTVRAPRPDETGLQDEVRELKRTLGEYRKSATRYRAERDEQARAALAQEEAAAMENNELTETIKTLEHELQKFRIAQSDRDSALGRTHREHTTETNLSAASPYTSWRPRGIDPNKKLKGDSADEYGPWRYAVDTKLEDDNPMYTTERSKIRYALSQMEEPIFSSMQDYVADNRSLTFNELMDEVEHYLGFHLQQRQAKKDLQSITQKQNEGITQYYHRIRSLWQKARTPEEDRVDQLLTTMLPSLSSSLLAKRYTSVRDLLDDARIIEDRKKDVNHNYPRPSRPRDSHTLHTVDDIAATRRSNAGRASLKPEALQTNRSATSPYSDTPNAKFGPLAKKPEDWAGPWYNPQTNPKKLDAAEKVQLIDQRRCWGCRGSGHRSTDSCCPMRLTHEKKMHAISSGDHADELPSDVESEKE